ncbi:MAG TPA: cytidine deaminase [Cyclobacteriaceae bacterium]|nr:cytidine deaminase [Cyclobacteriaceae bacterium]
MKDTAFFKKLDDLDTESKYLVHKAKEAAAHAYAPYSKFHVGAAMILDDGTIVTGSNQENASYPLCMCAERVALYAMSSLYAGRRITKMAIVANKKGHKELTPAASCGACRQVMVEFEERQHKPFEVILYAAEDKWIKTPSAVSLLPFVFSKDNLESEPKK